MVIAGGSGFVGRAIKKALETKGYECVILSRSGSGSTTWDGKIVGPWKEHLDGAAAVINLSGEPVAQKWTLQAQERIRSSRVDSTAAIGKAIQQCDNPPTTWINASAVGFYGDRADEILDESSPAGNREEFLVDTCLRWEEAQTGCFTPKTKQARVRIGFVCGNSGGGLPVLLKLTKAFIGGAVGSGNQWMSWIHLDDLANMFVWLVENPTDGTFNGTAPTPLTNRDFMATLRGAVGRPSIPPAPAFALKLASVFGAPDPAVVLEGQRALPKAAREQGFTFKFETLESALRDILKK